MNLDEFDFTTFYHPPAILSACLLHPSVRDFATILLLEWLSTGGMV